MTSMQTKNSMRDSLLQNLNLPQKAETKNNQDASEEDTVTVLTLKCNFNFI